MDNLNQLAGQFSPVPASSAMTSSSERVVAERANTNTPQVASVQSPSDKQVQDLNRLLQLHQQHLSFSIDEGSGATVLRVIETESGDIIRQMPNESWLKLAHELADSTSGLLSDHA